MHFNEIVLCSCIVEFTVLFRYKKNCCQIKQSQYSFHIYLFYILHSKTCAFNKLLMVSMLQFNDFLSLYLHLQAEARLAAKRAARAEAREIRMKELERQQKEVKKHILVTKCSCLSITCNCPVKFLRLLFRLFLWRSDSGPLLFVKRFLSNHIQGLELTVVYLK